jgi:hypothetical protein
VGGPARCYRLSETRCLMRCSLQGQPVTRPHCKRSFSQGGEEPTASFSTAALDTAPHMDRIGRRGRSSSTWTESPLSKRLQNGTAPILMARVVARAGRGVHPPPPPSRPPSVQITSAVLLAAGIPPVKRCGCRTLRTRASVAATLPQLLVAHMHSSCDSVVLALPIQTPPINGMAA